MLRPGKRCNAADTIPYGVTSSTQLALLMQITSYEMEKFVNYFPFHLFIMGFFFIANYYFQYSTEVGWRFLFSDADLVTLEINLKELPFLAIFCLPFPITVFSQFFLSL